MKVKLVNGNNNYSFDSKKKARWAAFFESLGVRYEYKTKKFEMFNGVSFTPDFSVVCHGDRGSFSNDNPFMLYVLVVDEMDELTHHAIRAFAEPLLLVSEIPDDYEKISAIILNSYWGIDGFEDYCWNYQSIDGDYFACYPACKDRKFYLDGDDSNYKTADPEQIKKAFSDARNAKFVCSDW